MARGRVISAAEVKAFRAEIAKGCSIAAVATRWGRTARAVRAHLKKPGGARAKLGRPRYHIFFSDLLFLVLLEMFVFSVLALGDLKGILCSVAAMLYVYSVTCLSTFAKTQMFTKKNHQGVE
jgi:hypothetical protein